MKISVRKTE